MIQSGYTSHREDGGFRSYCTSGDDYLNISPHPGQVTDRALVVLGMEVSLMEILDDEIDFAVFAVSDSRDDKLPLTLQKAFGKTQWFAGVVGRGNAYADNQRHGDE